MEIFLQAKVELTTEISFDEVETSLNIQLESFEIVEKVYLHAEKLDY